MVVFKNLDTKGLVVLWDLLFPEYSIIDFIEHLDFFNVEDHLTEIVEAIIEELEYRNLGTQRGDMKVFTFTYTVPKRGRGRKRKEEYTFRYYSPRKQLPSKRQQFTTDIKSQYKQRKQRMNKLREIYNKQTDKDEDFYDWVRNKCLKINNENINDFMESIKLNSVIDFSSLNRAEREKVFRQMKSKFKDIFGNLEITNNFIIRYRINGVWRSRTLTTEIWRQLMETLDKKEFIYDVDNVESSLIKFSDEAEDGVFKFIYFDAISIVPIDDNHKRRKDNRSSFFKYFNTSDLDLSRYQIFSSICTVGKNKQMTQIKELNDSCFIYALKIHGVSDDVLNKIRLRTNTRKLGSSKMEALCNEFKIHVIVKDLEYTNDNTKFRVNGKNYFGCNKKEATWNITLNSFKEHYFIDEQTKYTTDYIKHKYVLHENIDDKYFNKVFTKGKWKTDNRPIYFISSGDLIKLLFEGGHFTPMTYNNSFILNTTLYKGVNIPIDDLNYDPKYCTKLMKPIKRPINKHSYTYFYADFEADATVNPHKCYMCCIQDKDGGDIITFKGDDCDIQFLDYVTKYNNPIIYFHNLKYDFSFIAKYGITKALKKGSYLMRAAIEYKNKLILFRDTLPILSCKLSRLPQMFHFEDIQKEIFPYKYYTIDRLKSNKGVIAEAGVEDNWNDNDYKLFNENVDKINCRVDDIYFDMYKYAEFYCKQDVNILRRAFNQFANDFNKEFNINPFDYVSISSLANEVFNQRVYYPNKNMFKVGGHVREFMAKAIYGGRCMCAYNKKWNVNSKITTDVIVDYDAVSLYPSAMARLYTVEGIPVVIANKYNNCTSIPKDFEAYSAYIVEIKITNVGKHYPFPLIVQHTENGNLNKDTDINEQNPVTMVVDNIYLEDLVNFQRITFDIIRGYYWDGKKDYRIQDEIKHIFNKRLEYKKENNPLQELYKLIMNSCYGKCIEKPVTKDVVYVKDEVITKKRETFNPYVRFITKHYNEIVEDIKINDSTEQSSYNHTGVIHEIKRLKPTNNHFNNSLLGIQILSMSKRIMNEVMCLAYDIKCHIFYQDTDSMHIFKNDLPKLEDAYKNKYGRELRGNNLGQFHSDFPEVRGGVKGEVPVSIHSLFLMKKLYLDVLTDSSGVVDYMVRGKGLTQASIKNQSDKVGGYVNLYTLMYNGNTMTFDLTDGAPSFKFNKDFTVDSNEHFLRQVTVTYDEGNINDYFKS